MLYVFYIYFYLISVIVLIETILYIYIYIYCYLLKILIFCVNFLFSLKQFRHRYLLLKALRFTIQSYNLMKMQQYSS